MRFKKLTAKNVYSFKELDFDFSHHGTTLILGKNLDQNTANGAGKSSILKTLYFALWGKELNGESVDLIKTRGEKDGFIVELDFEDRGHEYKIIRYRDRKEKEAKTGVEFFIDNKSFNGETAVDTQKIIERKLKISPRLFLSSILTAQNETKHFLTVNDTDKKELFSELLDLTAYSKAYDIVKDDISNKEKERTELLQKIENISEKIKEKNKEIEDFETKEDSFEDNRIQEVIKIKKELDSLEKSLSNFTFIEEEMAEKESRLISLTEENNKLKLDLEKFKLTSKDERAITDLLSEYKDELGKLQRELDLVVFKKNENLTEISNLESSKFEYENKIISFISLLDEAILPIKVQHLREGLLVIKTFFISQIELHNEKRKALTLSSSSFLEKEKEIGELISLNLGNQEKLKQKKDKLLANNEDKEILQDKFVKTSTELNNLIKIISDKKRQLSEKTIILSKIETAKKILSTTETKESPYKELISLSTEKREFLSESLISTKKTYSRIEDEMKYLLFWKAAFSPIGIRSFIFDEVLELLNQKVQSNLNDLFEGAMSVIFESESKTQKGSISNKINTKFFLSGKETTYGLLSGGEQQRAILAVNLALSEIAESYSGSIMNIKFLDEPFNGIDSSGQIQCFRLFSRLAQTKDGLYVISHDESFQQLCPNSVYIIKNNGISSLTDRESFDKIRNN